MADWPELVLLALYGEELHKTRAVSVLESYFNALNSTVMGGPISAKVILLSAIESAIERFDSEFMMQFAEAFRRRVKPDLRDHWIVVDYIYGVFRRQIIQQGFDRKSDRNVSPVKIDELKQYFISKKGKNFYRAIDDLKIKKWIEYKYHRDAR